MSQGSKVSGPNEPLTFGLGGRRRAIAVSPFILLVSLLGLASCELNPEPTQGSGNDFPTLPRLAGVATVQIVVNDAPIVIELNGDLAPITAGNFVDLVQRQVYNGVAFHRVIREPEPFVAQTGDPQSVTLDGSDPRLGTGNFIDPATGSSRYIPLEITPEGADMPIYGQTFVDLDLPESPSLSHSRGAVAMARSQVPNSASSQFYITLTDLSFLDGQYAVFGYVTSGMEVVDTIQQGDRIQSASVLSGLENLQLP